MSKDCSAIPPTVLRPLLVQARMPMRIVDTLVGALPAQMDQGGREVLERHSLVLEEVGSWAMSSEAAC